MEKAISITTERQSSRSPNAIRSRTVINFSFPVNSYFFLLFSAFGSYMVYEHWASASVPLNRYACFFLIFVLYCSLAIELHPMCANRTCNRETIYPIPNSQQYQNSAVAVMARQSHKFDSEIHLRKKKSNRIDAIRIDWLLGSLRSIFDKEIHKNRALSSEGIKVEKVKNRGDAPWIQWIKWYNHYRIISVALRRLSRRRQSAAAATASKPSTTIHIGANAQNVWIETNQLVTK